MFNIVLCNFKLILSTHTIALNGLYLYIYICTFPVRPKLKHTNISPTR